MLPVQRLFRWLAAAAVLLLLAPVRSAQAQPAVAEPFRDYYARHQGIRVLGYPLTDPLEVNGYLAQYFEKGRIEDHRDTERNPRWQFMYGRLTAELMEQGSAGVVNATTISYADLKRYHDPVYRTPPPRGFVGGTQPVHDGLFVPYDAQLRPAPGYTVAPYFWAYINRSELFPGGWLHDIGLPISQAFTGLTTKSGERRTIFMQAFERSVLTYDMRNPAGWQVERGNIGADAVAAMSTTPSSAIALPAEHAASTLPLHILAHVGQPGAQMIARLRWQDGTELLRAFRVLSGTDGQGLLVGTLNWMNEGPPPQPPTQAATLEILSDSGEVQARRTLTMLSADDPATQTITLYWVLGEDVVPVQQRIPRTVRIGTAALDELLWGPGPPNLAGFTSAIPTPEQVLSYPGHAADWGPRVVLRNLKIVDGVATADFSRELKAYGGGSLRVSLLRQQITRTLLQFPTVRAVQIAIEGQTEGVLEP